MTIQYVAVEHHLKKQARHKKQDEDMAEQTYIFTISTGDNSNKRGKNVHLISVTHARGAYKDEFVFFFIFLYMKQPLCANFRAHNQRFQGTLS